MAWHCGALGGCLLGNGEAKELWQVAWRFVAPAILGFADLMKLRRPTGPYQYYEYDNPAQLAGAVIVQVVLHGLLLLLILRLSFSKSVSEFFRKEIRPVE